MPTPAILSGIMDPPPIVPVVEMNYVTGEYKINGEDTTFDALMYNASGTFEDIGLVPGAGITGLHWDTSQTNAGIWPPSIRGTQLLCDALALAMSSSGGLTAVCEFDVSAPEIYDANDQCPIFWFYKDSVWGDWAGEDGEVYWQCYIESGVQGEGYFSDQVDPANTSYAGGSAWEASHDRRYRMSGTWGFDLGPDVGVLRYDNGQSIDGQPQGIDTSFGQTPNKADNNLAFMDKIIGAHFFGVGVDLSLSPDGTDSAWWWWPRGGWDIRYLAFYRARPVSVLATLSRLPHTPIHVGQMYAEVIHSPIDQASMKMVPLDFVVEAPLPKMANIAPPTAYFDLVPEVLPINAIG